MIIAKSFSPNHGVERTASQSVAMVGEVGVIAAASQSLNFIVIWPPPVFDDKEP